MTKSAAITPMHRLFNRLREKIKETKIEIAELKAKVQQLEKAEAELVEKHSDPTLEFALNFYEEEFIGADPEELIEEEEISRMGPTEAVRQLFASADTSMTASEVRDSLEDMRQQGQLETQVRLFDSDKVNKILRGLTKRNFLVKEITMEGNRAISVYVKREEG